MKPGLQPGVRRWPGRRGPPASAAACWRCCRRRPRPCRAGTAPPGRPRWTPRPSAIVRLSRSEHAARTRSTVTTIRRRSSRSATTPAYRPNSSGREPLHPGRRRHQERVVGLRGDQQRPGRDHDAVAGVGHPRRRHQPAEARPHAGRGHGFQQTPHKGVTLVAHAAAGHRIGGGRRTGACQARRVRRRTANVSARAPPTRPSGSTAPAARSEAERSGLRPALGWVPRPSPTSTE